MSNKNTATDTPAGTEKAADEGKSSAAESNIGSTEEVAPRNSAAGAGQGKPRSPFAEVFQRLVDNGYVPIPLKPADKMPAEFRGGRWRGMQGWQRFCDAPAPGFILKLWASWLDTNVGVLCGTPARDGYKTVFVDIDTDDVDAIDELRRSIPLTPVKKRGRRGYTGAYQAPLGIKGFKTKICELLVEGRQTVVPPSVHPDTLQPYVWTDEKTLLEIAAADLPILSEDDVTRLRETVESLLGEPIKEPREQQERAATDPDANIWTQMKTTALARLNDWVPALGLYKCHWATTGYKAVATWRPSTRGRRNEERAANLSITPAGIRDFGTDDGYSPLDLVMAAKGVSFDEAFQWLGEQLGQLEAPPDIKPKGQATKDSEPDESGGAGGGGDDGGQGGAGEGAAGDDGGNNNSSAPKAPRGFRAFTLRELLADRSPMPPDIIAPRVLTPGGMLVLGGAPKIGKSSFVMHLLTHMAAGIPFLGFTPQRPLRIYYLQLEIDYHYLRERLQGIPLGPEIMEAAADNLVVTPRLAMMLNEDGLRQTIFSVRAHFPVEPPDIIVVDPIRNAFDGGEDGATENDNNAMLFFLRERVEKLRNVTAPGAGIILIHHTRKAPRKTVQEDPFQAFSGASSLRGYYTSGMLLHQPDEDVPRLKLELELRNGPTPEAKLLERDERGGWQELPTDDERIIRKEAGRREDAERDRKAHTILHFLFMEACAKRIYTSSEFARQFENKHGLGGWRTIADRITSLANHGLIKFRRDCTQFGLPITKSHGGYLVVEDMHYGLMKNEVDQDTGEVGSETIRVTPSHYRCRQSGHYKEVENPDVWVKQPDDDEEAES